MMFAADLVGARYRDYASDCRVLVERDPARATADLETVAAAMAECRAQANVRAMAVG